MPQILGFVDKHIRDARSWPGWSARSSRSTPSCSRRCPPRRRCTTASAAAWSSTSGASPGSALFLIKHYAEYYDTLNPPLDRDVIVAAAILHDIGKLRELDYHPVEAKYTKHGTLIGHIVLGRDMIRDKAREIGDFPEETLLLLEHAILAHHGRMEFGAPKEPSTIEALIVHYADEIDAKINAVASERMRSTTEEEFTGKIWAVEQPDRSTRASRSRPRPTTTSIRSPDPHRVDPPFKLEHYMMDSRVAKLAAPEGRPWVAQGANPGDDATPHGRISALEGRQATRTASPLSPFQGSRVFVAIRGPRVETLGYPRSPLRG